MFSKFFVLGAAVLLLGCSPAEPASDPGDDHTAATGSHTTAADSDWQVLYDGRQGAGSMAGWQQTGPGSFVIDADGSLKSQGGMGLFYYAEQQFDDFILEVEWRTESKRANSGVFVRFPSAETPWSAVEQGYEIQIDDASEGVRHTGGIYSFAAPVAQRSRPSGEWNRFTIEVRGQLYKVSLNGEQVTEFLGNRSLRGFVGLQNHDPDSTTWFRLVRVKPLPPASLDLAQLAASFATDTDLEPIRVLTLTATHGFRHQAAIEQTHALLPHLSAHTEFQFDLSENVDDLNTDNLANYDVLLLANATLRVDEPEPGTVTQLEFRAGDWRNYAATVHLPDRDLTGRIALSGQPPELSGMVAFDTGPREIEQIRVQGDRLHLSWPTGGGAELVHATLDMQPDGVSGTLTAGEITLPVDGVEIADPTGPEWNIQQPITAAHRAAILEFLARGGGLAGAHSALDALYGWRAYREIVGGGLFASHPWTQKVRINVEAPTHPTVSHLGKQFEIRDEIYVLDHNPRPQSVVLASLDSTSVEFPPADTPLRQDIPISWLRQHGAATVFMTKLGHFPDVWTNPAFIQHLLQGLRTAAGRIAVQPAAPETAQSN